MLNTLCGGVTLFERCFGSELLCFILIDRNRREELMANQALMKAIILSSPVLQFFILFITIS